MLYPWALIMMQVVLSPVPKRKLLNFFRNLSNRSYAKEIKTCTFLTVQGKPQGEMSTGETKKFKRGGEINLDGDKESDSQRQLPSQASLNLAKSAMKHNMPRYLTSAF